MTSYDPVKILSDLIEIISLSKEEDLAIQYFSNLFKENGIGFGLDKNNLIAKNKFFTEGKFTILLNSHLDTVKPNSGYNKDPYQAIEEDGKLFGLGSNDAGGALVSLLLTFFDFYPKEDLPFNLVFVASAEEEISGKNGMEYIFPKLPKIDFAVVGEPTLMQIAIAERGLMVLDCEAKGKSGHAARNEGVNAIYEALNDIEWFKTFAFPKVSETIGPVGMNVTMIESGTQHNVVPDTCKYVVDVRVNDCYSNQEVLEIIQNNVKSSVKARSTRLNSSGVNVKHPIKQVANELNIKTYGSPTLSDQALMNCESIKMGPGDSARSHTADEFIFVDELREAPEKYKLMLNTLGKYLMKA